MDGDVTRVVVAGGGLAAARTAQELRERGFAGSIVVVAAERHLPYDRPPLSKGLLVGTKSDTTLDIDWPALGVEVRLGTAATGWHDGTVTTTGGDLGADALVVATGARPVTVPGSEHAVLLRTVDDARRLRAALRPHARLVVVGAGWIGAEVATAASAAGCRVTAVEALAAPLESALGAQVGSVTAAWWADAGVDLRLSCVVDRVEPDAVHLTDGTRIPCDVTVVGVGARADVGWLAGSGVELDDGVLVDPHLRSSDPRVFAAGDAAAWWSLRYRARMRVHHWDDALHAPTVVAANVLGGEEVHDPVPYFWSDQFGRTVQFAGHRVEGDCLVWRGSPHDPTWSACWLRGRRLAGLVAVGRPRDLVQGRRVIAAGNDVDVDRLCDPDVAVRDAAR